MEKPGPGCLYGGLCILWKRFLRSGVVFFGWGGERGISSRILWSTPVWTFGVSGRGMLEKSQRLFPFRPFGFPPEPLTTSELRGMWWMFALVWFYIQLHTCWRTVSCWNVWNSAHFLDSAYFCPTYTFNNKQLSVKYFSVFSASKKKKKNPVAWMHQESMRCISGPSCSCLSEKEPRLAGSRTHLVELI